MPPPSRGRSTSRYSSPISTSRPRSTSPRWSRWYGVVLQPVARTSAAAVVRSVSTPPRSHQRAPYAATVMRLYDTMHRSVTEIVPATPGRLKLYACGPTVYRYAHVGNMRTFLLSDLIRRVAELHKLQVSVVQNITDVGHMTDDTNDLGDDKVLAQARAEGKTALEIAE